jgi:hypothetical protein
MSWRNPTPLIIFRELIISCLQKQNLWLPYKNCRQANWLFWGRRRHGPRDWSKWALKWLCWRKKTLPYKSQTIWCNHFGYPCLQCPSDLANKYNVLMDYVQDGGNLIMQYNQSDGDMAKVRLVPIHFACQVTG